MGVYQGRRESRGAQEKDFGCKAHDKFSQLISMLFIVGVVNSLTVLVPRVYMRQSVFLH